MTKSDIGRIERLLKDALPTLLIQTDRGVYAYDVVNGRPLDAPDKPSMSTNSMLAHALACLVGRIPESRFVGTRIGSLENLPLARYQRCLEATADRITAHITDVADGQSGTSPFGSPAFGVDDPFTLGWLAERFRYDAPDDSDAVRILTASGTRRVAAAFADLGAPFLLMPRDADGGPPRERAIAHPLPLLRLLQLAELLGIADDRIRQSALGWFRGEFEHQQAMRSTELGDFDVASMVFCIEGMLTAAPSRVPRPVIESVLVAVDHARVHNPMLRPSTPFKVTRSGGVHLFVSAEVTLSLLRIAARLDRDNDPAFFVALKPFLHDYLGWLQATSVAGTALPGDESGPDYYARDTPLDFVGWRSEHVHINDGTVNIWLTSQVVLLLSAYHALLCRDTARLALASAGLQLRVETAEPRTDAKKRAVDARAADPLSLGDNSPYRTASRIEELFVAPRLEGRLGDAAYSCLLYGPPGTGKTTLARLLARDLGWPLITVTTTDFLLEGENGIEARAKTIFDALNEQNDVVVFFDEIDRLVVDRDGDQYTMQGSMLQLMTPSMLTKLNDLRGLERSVIVIGTNYADRVDGAIKRAGRIDHKLLVLPPGRDRRYAILQQVLVASGARAGIEDLEAAASAGACQTFAELRGAARAYSRSGGALHEHVAAVVPAISIESWRQRMDHRTDPASWSEVDEEAFLLAYLLVEGQKGDHLVGYEWLANRWISLRPRATNIVRDPAVVAALDLAFGAGTG